MNEIRVGGDWCYHDQLDGRDLAHGDRLLVRWPDDFLEEVKVELDRGSTTVSDMGHSSVVSVQRAFTTLQYHGLLVRVPLRGVKARLLGRAAPTASVVIKAGERCAFCNNPRHEQRCDYCRVLETWDDER